MPTIHIKRQRTGSIARRPDLPTTRSTQREIPTITSDQTSPGLAPPLSTNIYHEEPETISIISKEHREEEDHSESRDNFPSGLERRENEASQQSAQLSPENVPRSRERSRTLDTILGNQVRGRVRGNSVVASTGTAGTINLSLPKQEERQIESQAVPRLSNEDQIGSTSSPEYPPQASSLTQNQNSTGRNRAGSISWVKNNLGLGTSSEREEQVRLRTSSDKDSRTRVEEEDEETENDVHHDQVVDHLNVIDPEVSAVTNLQDAANTIMCPPIPSLWKRKPTISLPQPAEKEQPPTTSELKRRSSSTSSRSTTSEDLLDAHVKDVLDKKRRSPKKEWIIRSLKGAWAFVKTPVGFVTAIYGFLVAFWGAAIVLFLLGWIDTGSSYNKKLWVEISSQIENGLFTITGVGFIPWRVRDAYRISAIWRLQHLDRKLRKKRGLPVLPDKNDLPDPVTDETFVQVLTDKQEARLRYQQRAFGKSQTWYRAHATETHKAFSLNWALWICLLTFGNSIFQCILCGTMWGLNRFNRPAWTTGCLIPASFLCGIAAAVLIFKGTARSKKTAEVEKKLRDGLGMSSDADAEEDGQSRSSGEEGKRRVQEIV